MSKSKQKGTWMETHVVGYLRYVFHDTENTIHRETLHGSKDVGDITGLYIHTKPCVLEVKNCKNMRIAQWLNEAETEADNAGAPYFFVIHHRNGVGASNMGKQYVTTTRENWEQWQFSEQERPYILELGNASEKSLDKWLSAAGRDIKALGKDGFVLFHMLRSNSRYGSKECVTTTLEQFCKMIGGDVDAVQVEE